MARLIDCCTANSMWASNLGLVPHIFWKCSLSIPRAFWYFPVDNWDERLGVCGDCGEEGEEGEDGDEGEEDLVDFVGVVGGEGLEEDIGGSLLVWWCYLLCCWSCL